MITVYQYTANGEVVYVGHTSNPTERRRWHRSEWFWHPSLVWSVVAVFDSRVEALQLERRLIRELCPRFNRQANPAYVSGSILVGRSNRGLVIAP